MENDLRSRARELLERPFPIPEGTEDNITDNLIRRYIERGPWDDPELQNLLRLCFYMADDQAEKTIGDAFVYPYWRDCCEILREILLEIYGEAVEPLGDDD